MAAAAHLALRDRLLESQNTLSIDLDVAAVTKNQQLIFTCAVLLPANKLSIADDFPCFHGRPASLKKKTRTLPRACCRDMP